MVIELLIAVAVALFASVGEYAHSKRVKRVARLAFGATGAPAPWACAAPFIRFIGLGLATWGALVLMSWDPVEGDASPSAKALRQLLVVLDVSPSMQIKDAGPDAEKTTRAIWAGKVTQGILDRLDMKDTRITMIAFYSKALTVLKDTTDKNVVANMLDGLPMWVAFEPGPTKFNEGVQEALKIARPWARKSSTLVVITDGDLDQGAAALGSVSMPASIADTIVIGVGDPNNPTIVAGHPSRQDQWTLKQIAAKLGGYYHEGNRLHLPSSVLAKLTMMTPRTGSSLGLREAALIAIGTGAGMVGLIGPALMLFGTPAEFARQRRRVQDLAPEGVV